MPEKLPNIPKHLTSEEDFYLSHPELDPKAQKEKAQRDEFLAELAKLEPAKRTEEAENLLWFLKSLTKEEVKKQLNNERKAGQAVGYYEILTSDKLGYQEKGIKYPFPSNEKIFSHLQNDVEFVKFLQIKEKQFENLRVQVSPFALSLDKMIKIISNKVEKLGGQVEWRSDSWKTDLNQLKYFTRLDKNDQIVGGAFKAEILAQPQKYTFILNGYIVSVVEDKDDLPNKSDKVTPIAGRMPLKGGETGIQYLKKFFDSSSSYYGEYPSIIPEEWLAMFSQRLHQKYILVGKNIEPSGSDIFDTKSASWFIDCLFSSGGFPEADWDPGNRQFNLFDDGPGDSYDARLARPALRRKLEI